MHVVGPPDDLEAYLGYCLRGLPDKERVLRMHVLVTQFMRKADWVSDIGRIGYGTVLQSASSDIGFSVRSAIGSCRLYACRCRK
jgi:hypothetical protein